jgi:hypothetical protein
MSVMKFITIAVILVAISAFVVAHQVAAPASTTVKHVPITNTPSD